MESLLTEHLDIWSAAQVPRAAGGRGRGKKSNGEVDFYGIKKLRELILGMSLRGLFVNGKNSLPLELDQEIDRARTAYFKAIKKKPKVYHYGPALLSEFKLPRGWEWKRIGQLCDLQTGATPSRQKPEYFDGCIRWLVSGDINQEVIFDCEGRITEKGLTNSNCKILPPDTVLIALNGQGKTRATVALLKVPAACNQSLVGMIPFDTSILDPTFLLLSLKYRYFDIREITGQKQRRGLNMRLVSNLPIPLAPLAEQHRIVAKVDELMALCDRLEQQQSDNNATHQTLLTTLLTSLTTAADHTDFTETWQRIQDHFHTLFTTEDSIDQLKHTILQLAVMGKLSCPHTSDPPIEEVLELLAVEKKTLGMTKKEKNIFENELSAAKKNIHRNSVKLKARVFCDFITKGTTPAKTELIPGGDIPFLKVYNIVNNQLDFLYRPIFISREVHQTKLKRSKVRPGDVIMNIVGPPLGKVAIITDEYSEWNMNQALAVFRPLAGIYNRYVYYMLSTSSVLKSVIAEVRGMAGQDNLSLEQCRDLSIFIPSVAEQHRIVAKLDELMALCDTLKTRLTEAQTTKIHLADAMVEQATG